ncbi:MAG: LacI family DNA-binding transcriptional regulator [Bifidobacterium sp.]|jgi:LacI family transcriptional regulator|nr:LacI family DNA-binding transcriptional regulator [Bifidobacterium sp.]MCI1865343.1 LacI family DNA-binding transcriptional regulator [Bifidobacterium sp.]
MTFATIKDVAHTAGVSVPTVSQVLNNTGRISQATRQKVFRSMRQLNYIPNSAAQSIRSSSTKTIGLLVPDIRNSYFAYLVASVMRELAKNGYVCLIGSSSESLEGQDKFLRSLLSQRIDGAIIVPQGTVSSGLVKFVQTDLPLVFLDRGVGGVDADHRVPLIDADPVPGTLAAIETAYSLGHHKIGFVHGPVSKSPNLQERQDVFVGIGRRILGEGNTLVAHATGAVSAVRELRSAGVDTFIFGYSPDALTAMRFFHNKRLIIGRDVSVISFDNIPFFELTTPGISIISQQLGVMGVRGARLLLSILDKDGGERGHGAGSERIPTTFVLRESVSASSR